MILHLMHTEKFIGPYIEFLKDNFEFEKHFFIVVGSGKKDKFNIPNYDNVLYLKNGYNKTLNYFKLFNLYNQYAKEAEKIIVHSFIRNRNLYYFYLNPKLLSKVYWLMWGADLYVYEKKRKKIKDKLLYQIRRKIYKKVAFIVSGTKGDYLLAKKWFDVKSNYIECFSYPTNLYVDYNLDDSSKEGITHILVGNSGDPSNNHLEIFEKLLKFKKHNIKIYVPLSYGDKNYIKFVINKGIDFFGDKFIPIIDFMPFDNYLNLLNKIDIAFFGHKRQQAMGNIRVLLGLGKKVYMNNWLTSSQTLKEMGVKTFDLSNICLEKDFKEKDNNIRLIKKYYSKAELIKCLNKLFES